LNQHAPGTLPKKGKVIATDVPKVVEIQAVYPNPGAMRYVDDGGSKGLAPIGSVLFNSLTPAHTSVVSQMKADLDTAQQTGRIPYSACSDAANKAIGSCGGMVVTGGATMVACMASAGVGCALGGAGVMFAGFNCAGNLGSAQRECSNENQDGDAPVMVDDY